MSNLIKSIRDRRANGDKGFSLIELLVVVAILAILAAIAIPLFLNQKNKAYQATAVADANTVLKELTTAYANSAVTASATVTVTNGAVFGGWTVANLVLSSGSTAVGGAAATASGVAPVFCVNVTNNGQTAIAYSKASGSGVATTGSCNSGTGAYT